MDTFAFYFSNDYFNPFLDEIGDKIIPNGFSLKIEKQ